jgi:hypothetical protein
MEGSEKERMQHLQALHAKAQQYAELKLSKIPKQLRPKLTIEDVYKGAGSYITIKGVPSDLQLQFFFDRFDDITRAGNITRRDHPDFNVARAVWFYGLDPKHHNSDARYINTRCNLWIMALLAARNGYVGGTQISLGARGFLLSFLYAWASSIYHNDVSEMDDWVQRVWRSGRYDLIQFRKSERTIIEKEIKLLKPKITAMKPAHPNPLFFLGQYLSESDAPKMALQYVLHHTTLEKTRIEAEQEQEQEMEVEMEMDVDVAEVDLRLVNWNEPFLSGILRKADTNIAVQRGPLSAVPTYITADEAIGLVKVDVDKMADDLSKMGISG